MDFTNELEWPHRLDQFDMGISIGIDLFDLDGVEMDDEGLYSCPLIPLRDMVTYPQMVTPLFVGRSRSVKAVQASTADDSRVVVVAQRDGTVNDPQPEDLYAVGTATMIVRSLQMPEGALSVLVQGRQRVEIVEYLQWEPYIRVRVRPLPKLSQASRDTEGLIRAAQTLFEKCIQLSRTLPEELMVFAANIDEPGRLADLVASALRLDLSVRQELLETLDPVVRLQRISVLLAKELDLLEVENRIQSEVQEQVDRSQREFFLREQIKAIQSELGEGDVFSQELADLRELVEEKDLPQHVKTRAMRELSRLNAMPPIAPESSIIRGYVDWLLELPWTEKSEDNLDIKAAAERLDADHYALTKAKERILEYLAVKQMAPERMRSPVLCFVGPPGTGKTSLGKSIARALGREFVRVSLGGVRDEAEIRGHRRTYIGALPGRIIQTMRRAGTVNPLFMLDEIDKLGADFRGDPSAALLEVLDPEQNSAFSDHYMELDYDLSQVMFITTANYLEPIPPALQDRLEVIEFPGYAEEEKVAIARQFLIPRQLEENGVKDTQLRFSEGALQTLIRDYTYEAGVRNLEREIANVCRKIARLVAEGKRHPRRVSEERVSEFLGPPSILGTLPLDQAEVGIATGVAWTPAGGDLMVIEVALMEGKGNITMTGQLGNVMQESAQAAFSYLRSSAERWSISSSLFDQLDVHVHAPEGAVPKDGPSAGVTLLTALTSAFSGRPVRHTVGMTGEITLSGRVLPVGGVKAKLLAARRAGLTHFVMPRRNEQDLEEIPRRLRKGVEIVLVDRVDEVLETALLPSLEEEE
jgi:ATP-dependent Lon protease